MAIDQLKARRLEQMGLGPVWVLRMPVGHALDASRSESAAPSVHVPAPRSEDYSSAHANGAIPAMDWDTLESTIRSCTSCGLCKDRGHAVPGIGDRQARWLFIGEGPGRQEDLQGEPFVGPAGKLLDNMMRALGLARGKHTYIANIVKCRPVGDDGRDRPPSADESAACMPYLERQIALIKPDVIIALGKTAAASLLGVGEDTALSGLRGKPHSYAGIPLVVTYHPAYLLRKPADKAKSWQDLCLAQRLYDER